MGLTLDILNDVRAQIATDDEVLSAARARRDLVAEAAMTLPGALRRFSSGSVAHGTVNDPVTDADGGIALDRRSFPMLGPDGDGDGPAEGVNELCKLVGERVREEYPEARVTTSKRGLKVTFNAPINGQDPSVDLIVALTRKDADGLWIPNLETDDWDASDPEEHTKLFTAGTRKLRALRARVTRLAKAWNKQWSKPALSSFNLEALAWEYVDDEDVSLDEALAGFFAYARDEVEAGDTEDPAGVSEPIRLLESRETAVKRLSAAAEQLERALANDDDEEIVRDALSSVFHDYVDPPAGSKSALARVLTSGNSGVGATKAGIAVGTGAAVRTTRAFGGDDV